MITGVGNSTTGVLEVAGAGAAGGVEVTTDEVEGVSTGAAGGVEVSSGATDEGVSAGTEVSAGGGDWASASEVVMVTVGRAEVTLTVTVLTLVEETVVTASGSGELVVGSGEEVVAGRGTTDVR